MDGRQAAAMAAHLVFFAAAMSLAAHSVQPLRVPRAPWSGWSRAAEPGAPLCIASFGTSASYLDRLGQVLSQSEGESPVSYDAPECAR
jgi:hypothetical protein